MEVVANGFILRVGCQTLVAETPEKLKILIRKRNDKRGTRMNEEIEENDNGLLEKKAELYDELLKLAKQLYENTELVRHTIYMPYPVYIYPQIPYQYVPYSPSTGGAICGSDNCYGAQ